MARYRQGPYIVEEGYAMIDQDGQVAHQETFAETPAEASRLMWRMLGDEAQEGAMDTWSPGMAVLVTDTNLDYRPSSGGRPSFPTACGRTTETLTSSDSLVVGEYLPIGTTIRAPGRSGVHTPFRLGRFLCHVSYGLGHFLPQVSRRL